MFNEPPPKPPSDDIFEEMSEELTTLQKVLKDVSPLAMDFTTNTLTVASAILLWFLVPPINKLTTIASVGAAGFAGRAGGKKLRRARRGVVPSAIAELVQEQGLRQLNPAAVQALAQRYGVPPDEFAAQLYDIYDRFLKALLDEPDVIKSAEVSQLAALRRGLGLRWNETDALHTASAAQLLAEGRPPSAKALPPELKKLLWLSVSLFSTAKKADPSSVPAKIGITDEESDAVLAELSTPLYKAALAQAVGKYNRTETPEVLQTVRKALCLTDGAAERVHNAMYDAQLSIILPADDPSAKLTEEDMALLGELEGILQIRNSASRLQARTVPMYRAIVAEALEKGLLSDPPSATSLWGGLALRTQELVLSAGTAKDTLVEEARRITTDLLNEAAQLQSAGDTEGASAKLNEALRYGEYVGSLIQVTGWEASTTPASDLAEQYLGALSMEPGLEAAAQALVRSSLGEDGQIDGLAMEGKAVQAMLRSMLSLSASELDGGKKEYAKRLETVVAAGDYGAIISARLAELGASLGLPEGVRQKLALSALYEWLLDLSEREERAPLEQSGDLIKCLRLSSTSVGELHLNTEIDEVVLSKCTSQLLAEQSPLSADAMSWLQYLSRQLQARAGVLDKVLREAGAASAS